MEICKAPTQQLKVPNKHSLTRIIYIKMENVISDKKKNLFKAITQCSIEKGSSMSM